MRSGWIAIVTGGFAAISLVLVINVGSATAGRTSDRGIIGTYRSVVHATSGQGKGQAEVSTVRITKFDPRTGAFSGTAKTKPSSGVSVTITGTVTGRKIRMRAAIAAANYTSNHRGTIRTDGTITGSFADSNGLLGKWTMTRERAAKPSKSTSTISPKRATKPNNSISTTALIWGVVVTLLMFVGLFLLVRWIVRLRQAAKSGATYEQMVAQQRARKRAGAPTDASNPPPTGRHPPASAANTAPTKKCPDCAETVLAAAKVCRYCHYRFDQSLDSETPLSTP